MNADATVRARVDSETKEEATRVLGEMGLSVAEAIRLLLAHVAAEKTLPGELNVPNAETLEAMAESERGEGQVFGSVEEFLADVNARD